MNQSFKLSDYRDGTAGRVPCPRCGILIAEDAIRCDDCGVHFSGGTAYDFAARGRMGSANGRRVRTILLLLLIAAMALTGAAVLWL